MKEGRAPTTVESHASLEQKRRDFTVVVQEGTRSGAGSERAPGPSQAVFRLVKVFFFSELVMVTFCSWMTHLG